MRKPSNRFGRFFIVPVFFIIFIHVRFEFLQVSQASVKSSLSRSWRGFFIVRVFIGIFIGMTNIHKLIFWPSAVILMLLAGYLDFAIGFAPCFCMFGLLPPPCVGFTAATLTVWYFNIPGV
jgi:hypothetical protein